MKCKFSNGCFIRDYKQLMEKYKITIYIIGGVALYIPKLLVGLGFLSNSNYVISNIVGISTIIASTILASGVFASIVKSLLFKDIYASVLADIIFGEKYLAGRSVKELQEIWKRVSSALYNNDFPELNKKIQNHVLNVYLPSEHDYYYKDCRHIITYSINKENPNYIDIIEEICSTVVGVEPNTAYKFGSSFYFDQECGQMKDYSVEEFEVDGISIETYSISGAEASNQKKESMLEVVSETVEGVPASFSVRCKYNFEEAKESCRIRRKTKCTYPFISLNKVKTVNFKRFVDGLIVIIKYPAEQCTVDFATLGSLKNFEDRCEDKQGVLCKEHNDIIFPNQGFLIYLDKNNEG